MSARRATLRLAGLGMLLGAAWGAAARLFMRFLATEPEFSWAATLGIIGLSAWLGALLGVVRAARLRGRSRWWRVMPLLGVILFASPGMLLLPTVLACLVAVRFRRPAVRLAVACSGLAVTLAFVLTLPCEEVSPDVSVQPHMVAPVPGVLLLSVCAVLLGMGCAEATRPWVSPGVAPPESGEVADPVM